ncbi:YlxR family protein [Dehalococcoides mccartyi]|nr:YlxR family protein [Dehalococcoides mccartyi]
MSQKTGHIPTRTCVVCREKRPRIELLRIVRTPKGEIVIDKTGRMDGRGAYVCQDSDHQSSNGSGDGVVRGRLSSAFRTKIDDSTMRELNEAIVSQVAK